VKQLTLAVGMYVADHDGSFPMSAFPAGAQVATMNTVVLPYVKNDQLSQCPSEPQAMDVVAMFAPYGGPAPGTPRYTSYTTNADIFLNGYLLMMTGGATVDESALPRAAETILLYDGNVTLTGEQPVQARHNGTFNAGFADGHAKSITAEYAGTATHFTGATISTYRIGATGGFYQGMTEAKGIPQ
jgi:prepilin-type processing-associated H-X9-DG protein